MNLLDPQLLAFLAVVKHKTVHAGAESLFMTQTAITQRIRSLEQKLNTTLFIRSRRGMSLTAEGQALLHYCQATKMLEGEFFSKIDGSDEDSIININLLAPTSIMRTRIIPASIPVIKKHKNIRVNFQVNDIENRHIALKTGECDLAIVASEHVSPEMASKGLTPDKYLMVGPKSWEKRTINDVIKNEKIIDFDDTDNMTFNYLRKFSLFDSCQKDRHFINTPENLIEFISKEIGYTVLTEEFYNLYVDNTHIAVLNNKKFYLSEINLCWYQRHQMPRYFSELIDRIN